MDAEGLVSYGLPATIATCLIPPKQQDRRASCLSISHEPSPSEAAAILVHVYYELWGSKKFPQMYAMLSESYRAAHPYSQWLSEHVGTDEFQLSNVRVVSPTLVSFDLFTSGRVTPSSDTIAYYTGTWGLVREGGQLRLNSASLRQTK
jgi:hypothetical protein